MPFGWADVAEAPSWGELDELFRGQAMKQAEARSKSSEPNIRHYAASVAVAHNCTMAF